MTRSYQEPKPIIFSQYTASLNSSTFVPSPWIPHFPRFRDILPPPPLPTHKPHFILPPVSPPFFFFFLLCFKHLYMDFFSPSLRISLEKPHPLHTQTSFVTKCFFATDKFVSSKFIY